MILPHNYNLLTVDLQLSFEIGSLSPPTLPFFSNLALASQGPWHLQMNFRINLSMSTMITAAIVINIPLNFMDQFVENRHLYNSEYSHS